MVATPTAASSSNRSIADWLGEEADSLLNHQAKIDKSQLHLPGPDWVNRIFAQSDRTPQVLRSLQQLYSTGRLANTGYLSILPVDQGIERIRIARHRVAEPVAQPPMEPAAKGPAAAELVLIEPALALMHTHGGALTQHRQRERGIDVLLIGGVADLVQGRIEAIERIGGIGHL